MRVPRPIALVRRPGGWLAGLTAGCLVALAVAHTALALSRTHGTTSDWASIEMRTRDVFSRHPPLIGAWSRYEWSHPGPLLFYVFAVPYRLGGQSWQAMWVAAALVNTVAVAAAVWLAARRNVALGATVLLAGLATVAGFRSHLFTDTWNATIVVLPVLTVVLAALAVLQGDRAGLPVLVVAYDFVAQGHVGFGAVLLPVTAWALVVAWRAGRRRCGKWLAVGVALWLPVVVDTLANWPGNFVRMVGWNVTAHEPTRGLGEALRVVGRATSLTFVTDPGVPSFDVAIARPPWGTAPFLGLVLAALAYLVARRCALLAERRLLELVGVTWLVGFVAVARIKGPLLRWIVDWTYPLVALTWAVTVSVAARAVLAHRRGGRVGVRLVAVGAAATLVAVNVVGSVGEPYINAQLVPIVRQFARAAEADPRVRTGPILVDIDGELRLTGAVQAGMINLMEKDGLAPRARRDQGLQFGGQRIRLVRPERLVVRAETVAEPLAGGEVLSVRDPLTAAERAEADALTARLTELLEANGLADKVPILATEVADLAAYQAPPAVAAEIDAFGRLTELRRRGPRLVLYFVPG